MQSHQNDTLQLYKEERLIPLLQKDQKIIFSCEILKYNDSNKCQYRIFLITDTSVYNLQQKQNFIKSMMSKLVSFNRKFIIKRALPLGSIQAITLSNYKNNKQFILHIKNDYDYRFHMEDKNMRKLLFKCLCLQYEKVMKRKMAFYFKDDITLAKYCTMKGDLKSKTCRMPKQNRVYLDIQDLVDYEPHGVKFQLIYTFNGKSVEISKFLSSSLEIIKQDKQYYSIQSKNVKFSDLQIFLQNKHQFIYLPHYIFSANQNLYLLRPMMIGGKMDKLQGPFKIQLCIFYIAQIILVLEFLHSRKWVYRAVSLSNFYIKQNGYIAVDGMNKLMRRKKEPSQYFYDICGLPQNLAPEMILCSGHNQNLDVWGVGICAYNLIQSHHPFFSQNVKQTFRNILQKKISQPQLPKFVINALAKDPKQRPTLAEIKKDIWFKDINWEQIQKQVKISPYIPELTSVFKWEGKLPSIVCLQDSKK